MADDLITRVTSNPKYQELKSKRSTIGWLLTLSMMVVYYGFILLVAYNKPLLATKIGGGVTTLGMPLGSVVGYLGRARRKMRLALARPTIPQRQSKHYEMQ